MTSEQRRRFRENTLTEKDKQDILRDGPFCPLAEWTGHKTNGKDRIHCRLLGPGAHVRISPEGLACRHCKHGPRYVGAGREFAEILADSQARSLGPDLPAARRALDTILGKWNVNLALPNAREFFARTLLMAPALAGLPEEDALALAREKALVD